RQKALTVNPSTFAPIRLRAGAMWTSASLRWTKRVVFCFGNARNGRSWHKAAFCCDAPIRSLLEQSGHYTSKLFDYANGPIAARLSRTVRAPCCRIATAFREGPRLSPHSAEADSHRTQCSDQVARARKNLPSLYRLRLQNPCTGRQIQSESDSRHSLMARPECS